MNPARIAKPKQPQQLRKQMTDTEFQKAVISIMKDYWGSSYVEMPEETPSYCYKFCYGTLTYDQIIQAVAVAVTVLGLPGGSGLYEPIGALLLDLEKREQIDQLMKGWNPRDPRFEK